MGEDLKEWGTELCWGKQPSSATALEGKLRVGPGKSWEAGLAFQVELPLWVSVSQGAPEILWEGTLICVLGGLGWTMNLITLQQGQTKGKASGATSSKGSEKEHAPAEDKR